MSWTAPYEQQNYMGEHANDTNATQEVRDNEWDTNGNGTGDPQKGMFYYNTTDDEFRVWTGSSWDAIGAGTLEHNSLNGLQGGYIPSIGGSEYFHLSQNEYNLLRGGSDASSLHNHDSLYFRESEFISSSTGAPDAGKPIVLDANGLLDGSFINEGDIEHGNLSGLGADDHTQYILVNGTRAFTGDQSMGSNKLTDVKWPTNPNDAASKQYVDQHRDWQESVIDKDLTNPPGSPSDGDRYIVAAPAGGAWAGHEDDIAEYESTSIGGGPGWKFTTPTEGTTCLVEDEDTFYVFDGSSWGRWAAVTDHNSLSGLQGGYVPSIGGSEYFHLSQTSYNALTSNGGIGNASTEHIHDDRYYTETELGSTTGGSEGASLIGTDTKPNLGNATDVEAAITFVNDNFVRRFTGAATNPNGTVTPDKIGDVYISTTAPYRRYINVTGTNTGWRVI